ncbi:hypothetical protein [Rathayibacter rathayi]|uniref:hypothetical protein n=1 Tax=Rathayibacter rathayi TaxID=33887 RepID=UPI000FD8CF47|nr:hypothetical protein [Rathayibacter rathayi]MWV75545.1 hypothetical protein [Rathayibacter rathayi NCPPB 2980 = VKM Ac-1601]
MAVAVVVLLSLSACAPAKVEDFVYRGAAQRAHDLGDYIGGIFVAQSEVSGIEDRVRGDSSKGETNARFWTEEEPNISFGGNWITSVDQGITTTDVSADALITMPGQQSGGLFSSQPVSVLLCVRYQGKFGSREVRVVDGQCPEGVQEQLRGWTLLSVDKLDANELSD